MSSGGGSTTPQVTNNYTTGTSSVQLPDWAKEAGQRNIARANMVADLGYIPQYGIDVAGFTPMQTSAMQNTADAASAFGLQAPTDVMAGMPKQTTNNLGFTGYSSGDLYDSYLANLAAQRPAQYLGINQLFTDPVTGVASLPTAMDVLLNPKSSQEAISALSGTVGRSGSYDGGGNYAGVGDYDPEADNRTEAEVYMDSLKWLAGDAGWHQDLINKAGATSPMLTGLDTLANVASKYDINHYIDNYGVGMNNGYGITQDAFGNKTTTNKELADRMGWTYIPPPPPTTVSSGSKSPFQLPDFINPSTGINYNYSSGSGSLMNHLGNQVGVGGVHDASKNSGYAG
jgi:hypothetical protein